MPQSFAKKDIRETPAPGGSAPALKRTSGMPSHARKSSQDNLSDPELSALWDAWKSLSIVERGKRLRSFTERYSLRSLARVLNCSEARIRQLVDLSKLPPEAERELHEGRIGVKRALKVARDLRDVERRRRLMSTDPASRQKLIESGAALIIKWILELFPEAYAAQFLRIVAGEEYGPAGQVFLKLRPKPHTIWLSADPVKVIRRFKPKCARPEFGAYRLNFCIAWWAAWGPRVMPDPQVRSAAVALAEHRLYVRIYEGRLTG